jgi:hypothetical protein
MEHFTSANHHRVNLFQRMCLPTEAEVATAVQCLKTGKAPGQSRIQAEHLKTLLQAATKDECTPEDWKGWELLVQLVQHMFAMGEIPIELSWSILVLITKDSGSMQGITVNRLDRVGVFAMSHLPVPSQSPICSLQPAPEITPANIP